MLNFLNWLEQTSLGAMAQDSVWLFPLCEILHFLGLSLLIGSMLVIDLRLLGFWRQVSLEAALKLIPLAGVGILLNLITGFVFISAYPQNYYPSTAFRIKMAIIVLGGLNALWFKWIEFPRVSQYGAEASFDMRIKMVALLSLLVWFSAIVLGRFLPFVSVSTG